jgi:hypothetical protein
LYRTGPKVSTFQVSHGSEMRKDSIVNSAPTRNTGSDYLYDNRYLVWLGCSLTDVKSHISDQSIQNFAIQTMPIPPVNWLNEQPSGFHNDEFKR